MREDRSSRRPSVARLCAALRPRLSDAEKAALATVVDGDLDTLAALATSEELEPALWSNLVHHGLVRPVPASVRRLVEANALGPAAGRPVALHLEQAYEANVARNAALRSQLREIVSVLNTAGIEPALLKGARWTTHPAYRDPAARSMVDIDLFAPPGDAAEAAEALAADGYRTAHYPLRDQGRRNTHLVPLHRPDRPAPVELHVELGDWPTPEMLPARAAWSASVAHALGGDASLRVRHLHPTHQVLHTILHSEIHHRGHTAGEMSVRSLHDLAAVGATSDAGVDWSQIAHAFRGREHVLHGFLYQLHVLFGEPMPPELRPTARARRHFRRCTLQRRLPTRAERLAKFVTTFPGTLGSRRMSYLYDCHGVVATNAARARHVGRMLRLSATRAGQA